MRETVSISLKTVGRSALQKRAKARGFESVSTYVNYLICADDDVISEDELLRIIRKSQKEYREGKTIKANSISDLL